MAYASTADVEAILPPDEEMPSSSTSEFLRLEKALDEATDLVIGYLRREYVGEPTGEDDPVPDDVPGAVRRVTARVALRAFIDSPDNPGAEAETNLMGPFSHTINWSREAQARDFYLTDSDRLRLDRFRLGYSGGAAHVPMYQECPPPALHAEI